MISTRHPMRFTTVRFLVLAGLPMSERVSIAGNGRLSIHALATNASHADGQVELDVHNIWGLMEEKATHLAVQDVIPNKRPFLISRSTFPSSGRWTGHWVRRQPPFFHVQAHANATHGPSQLGDNFSLWAYLRYSIAVRCIPSRLACLFLHALTLRSGRASVPNLPNTVRWRRYMWLQCVSFSRISSEDADRAASSQMEIATRSCATVGCS